MPLPLPPRSELRAPVLCGDSQGGAEPVCAAGDRHGDAAAAEPCSRPQPPACPGLPPAGAALPAGIHAGDHLGSMEQGETPGQAGGGACLCSVAYPPHPVQYIHHRLIHLTPADYDDFVNAIRSARSAFCLTPMGMMQFNDILQNLKRSKQTKELWQRVSLEMTTFSP